MKENSRYLKNIRSANNDNSLAIFVGAGISKSSETSSIKLPSWNDLIIELKKELGLEDEADYLKVAQLYYLAFGEYTYYKKLKEFFPSYVSPSQVHKIIFEINPHVIITTNWDNILEKAIDEYAYIYDVICSDNDLVKSNLQNKLIKMHGDFKNHNIVFKEDDYINYSFNFPLIENYIKSILSTHTILFLGYSYNDSDLKHMVKWIQNQSNVRPPMYLVTYNRIDHQIKYLENHQITTLIIENIDGDLKDSPLDNYSKKMYSFLRKIADKDGSSILEDIDETIDFVLNRIEKLNELNAILFEQIQNAFSNCNFLFDEDLKAVLKFYEKEMSGDYDKTLRAIYQKFVVYLREIEKEAQPSSKTLQIFEILNKSGIKGIVISSDNVQQLGEEYISILKFVRDEEKEQENRCYNFDFNLTTVSGSEINELFEFAFINYNLSAIEEAFTFTESLIKLCLNRRQYAQLFVAMFNRNSLLKRLKYGLKYAREKYTKYQEYDLKEQYQSLPKNLKIALEPVYQFVDFSLLYRYFYDISEDLKKTEDAKRTIETGGMVFGSNIYSYASKHANLVSFVLNNGIMVEEFSEYQTINKLFVKIALLRQTQNDTVSLTRTELFSCIKYIDEKDLRILFEDYYGKKTSKKQQLRLSGDLMDWAVETVLPNITAQHLKSSELSNRFEHYIEKVSSIKQCNRSTINKPQ